jgi:hypothetical protein
VLILGSSAGAIHSIMGGKHILSVDYKLYQMTYFIGMPLSVIFYVVICKIFPPPGLGIAESLESDDLGPKIIKGVTTGEFTGIDTKDIIETKSEDI